MDLETDPGGRYLRLPMDDMLAAQTKEDKYKGKKMIWVTDPDEGYIRAEIKGEKGDDIMAATVKGNDVTVKKDDVMEVNPPKFFLAEDMSTLTYLNDASVLDNLRQRYYNMLIYTYSGLFCVVINPYKRLPIYTESVSHIYMGKRKNEVPPHLFAVSDEAYRNMLQDRENQSMLITGESGAGKTENTKKVIAYFAFVGQAKEEAANMFSQVEKPKDAKPQVSLEDKIVRTNPVLEAYGNAKTVRNNNSSRFGKFIRIHFSKDGRVAGCDIEHYLLEKSRVIKQAPGERCYHIFYQIASGGVPGLVDKLQLTMPIKEYSFVNQAETTIEGVDDVEEMQMTDESYDIMGFSADEKFRMYQLCSAHLHMGMMKFKQRPREEQAEFPEDDVGEAEKACAMYGVDHLDFLKSIVKPRVRVGNEWVNKGQNLEQVHWSVGAMAKAVYARMFHWLINRCNLTLDAQVLKRISFIGVLDIAGFEIFDLNSFEQLWINFVNERLQQFFNHHMFILEQEEYKREGIVWTFIDFGLDLQACIELIEKPMGIISMLDEECVVPKGTDLTLASKLTDMHLGKHPNFRKPLPPKGKQGEAHFALAHYAGVVRYNVTVWLEKNKDPLNDTCVSVLKATKGNELLNAIWEDYTTQEEAAAKAKSGDDGAKGGKKKGKSASMATVSMVYRESLNKLMNMLHTTHPHFIRCIIPNELKKSGMIDAALCLNQLTCNGVLEGIRICRKGFPNRMMHADFRQRYAVIAADESKSSDDATKCAQAMSQRFEKENVLQAEQYRMGTTKVFFKAGILAHLEEYRDKRIAELITGLQAQARSFIAVKDVKVRKEQQVGVRVCQNNIRMWMELRTWSWFILLGKVKPLATAGKTQEILDELQKQLDELSDGLAKEKKLIEDLNASKVKMTEEKVTLTEELKVEMESKGSSFDRGEKLNKANQDLEKELESITNKISDQEQRTVEATKLKKKVEIDGDEQKKKIQELEMALRKSESEKQSRDHQIHSFQEEMTQQEEMIAKLTKEIKAQEDNHKKNIDDLGSEEDKVNHLTKLKNKLESHLSELEDSLEREKRQKQEVDKGKRKVEGELKVAHETQEEINHQKRDLENNLKKKESENHLLQSKMDDEQSLVARLQKQIKELQAKCEEREEELEAERQARSRSERAKSDMQQEFEELSERLEEAGGATSAQIELNKKREAELSKLRRDLEECNLNHENQLVGLRKKHNDAVAEMTDQLDQLQKQKAKIEKDKSSSQREIEDMNNSIDSELKVKSDLEKRAKTLELGIAELQAKSDEQGRQLQDMSNQKNRLGMEAGDLARQLEDVEAQVAMLQRLKSQMSAQVEEAKQLGDNEARERQSLSAQFRNAEHELDTLREQLEEESEGKAESQRQVSKAVAEMQQWKAKFEGEGLLKADEMEEAKRKLMVRMNEIQDSLDQVNNKIAGLEKSKHRLMGEIDDAQVDVERATSLAAQLEKKQKGFDQVIEGWKKKTDDMSAELDASQRETRDLSTDVFKTKAEVEESREHLEALKRENKALGQEIKDLADQLGEGGRSVHEMQKMVRRLEAEKEELQAALDEAEVALEAEESKVLRSQVEVQQIRSEIEKRIQEKEEEFENTRKNHARSLESMQASLETEAKSKNELLRIKKKLESDINELEIALDHANKANAEAQKNLKRFQEQIREIQSTIEDEQRQKQELLDQFSTSEKRGAILQGEIEENRHNLEQVERARNQAQMDSHDAREQANELSAQASSLNAGKRKLEGEMQALHADLDDTLTHLKASEENSKKASSDAARLAEELRQEQEHAMHVERMRKGLEATIQEMQVRLDEAEAAALKGGKKIIAKLESRVRELEGEMDNEGRRCTDLGKNISKQDRKIKELEFQIDEEKKNHDRLTQLVDTLQTKIKSIKRLVEEAEEQANVNLQKYRQLQHQLEDAEERADVAENSLAKFRAKSRSSASLGPPGGLSTSASVGAFRSASRSRF